MEAATQSDSVNTEGTVVVDSDSTTNQSDSTQVEGTTETSESSETGSTEGDNKQDSDGISSKKAKKQIGKLTAKNYTQEAEIIRLKDELAQNKPDAQPTERPQEDDFDDLDKFQDALTNWHIDKRDAEKAEGVKLESENQRIVAREQSYDEKATAFLEKHDDFYEVSRNEDIVSVYQQAPNLVAVIEESDSGPELAYHFGMNPDKAVELANMTPMKMAIEVGKLEAALASAPVPRKVSKAPDPINPVGGGSEGAGEKNPDDMDTKEWLEWRNKTKTVR